MNTFMNAMKQDTNFTLTENGAITHKSTLNGLMDLFALGGAYRQRTDADCITLFKAAFDEDEAHALKCLFYLRDVRGGQGERRFFRVVSRWLAFNETAAMRRNLKFVPEYGRWDDFYVFVGTPLEDEAFKIMRHQLALDVSCKTPSLLAKWLKSENTSSKESRRLATISRNHFHMTPKEYRKTLSVLRERIRIVERLMSENRWDEIEFDKIPSRAGIIYRNAFARRDRCVTSNHVTGGWCRGMETQQINTLFEDMKAKWARCGYKMPSCVFWNLNARNNNIPAIGDGFSYVSGFSPIMIQQILSGKDGLDLVLEKLDSERYAQIH